jgi:hypothetical protein
MKQRVFVDKDKWECRGRCEPGVREEIIVYCLYCHHDDIVETSCLHVVRDYEGTHARRCRRIDLDSRGYCRAHEDNWKEKRRFKSINYKVLDGWGTLFEAFGSAIFDDMFREWVSRFEKNIFLPANALLDVVDYYTKESERVYFIRAGNVVKIGRSLAPENRLKALKKNTGETIVPQNVPIELAKIVWTFPGGRRAERALHIHFAKYRVAGEWFRWSREIERFVKDGLAGKHISVRDFAVGVQARKAELEKRGVA